MKDYSLNLEQQKAFKALNRAFEKCKKTGIYLWDNYGTISGVNGKIVNQICPDESYDELLDDFMVETISACFVTSNADDPLFVNYI